MSPEAKVHESKVGIKPNFRLSELIANRQDIDFVLSATQDILSQILESCGGDLDQLSDNVRHAYGSIDQKMQKYGYVKEVVVRGEVQEIHPLAFMIADDLVYHLEYNLKGMLDQNWLNDKQ